MTVTESPTVTIEEVLSAHIQPEVQPVRRFRLRSMFLLSFVLFCGINFALTFTGPLPFDPFKFNYKGWAWWTFNDLRTNQNVIHNVALLGSSTMVAAISGCDANYLNKPLDLCRYHKMSYLESRLEKSVGGKFDVFSLAAPGQMPSDALLSLKAMVLSAHRPDVVIYGLAPRDFIDSTLGSPGDTEPFKYFTRIVNIDDVVTHEFRNPFGRLDWLLSRVFVLYGNSLDFRMLLAENTETFLNKYVPKPWTSKPFTWWDRVRMIPTYLPGEIHPEAVIAAPLKRSDCKYIDNTMEYRSRYKQPDEHTFSTQFFFLRKLAEFCHKERIELILVNMPISEYNAGLLPPGLYFKYLNELNQFSWNNNVCFYDLCLFKNYSQKDFHDSVHMNAFGGRKFFDSLYTALMNDSRAYSALQLTGMQLQARTGLASKKIQTEKKPL